MKSATSYSLQPVLDAIGITESTLTNWSIRYKEVGVGRPGRGRGRERRVPADSVIVLAVMKSLSDLGLGPFQAIGWASMVRDTIAITKKHPSLTIRAYPDGEIIALPDPPFAAEPPKPGAEVELKINVRRIIARVHAALEQPAAKAA